MKGPHVVIVPGAAVREYVEPVADTLIARGVPTRLLDAPGQPGAAADLRTYGAGLGRCLSDGEPVDLLVGLSVGTQAVAVAAAAEPGRVGHLVLVGPTVDPDRRTVGRFVAAWARAGLREDSTLLPRQAPDWRKAGVRQLAGVVRSALSVRLEKVLADVSCPITVVHAERDVVTSHGYAAGLATVFGQQLVVIPGATHSWPYADGPGFADLVEGLLR
ncbi:MAG TPA: alpha/beta hydrolase [Lapillicoccus sp.]|jgi:pimeloyl-ACP methyl ester carboxylesterase|nr:alpha/beta hydrolase [Lapillicoccus sp.]